MAAQTGVKRVMLWGVYRSLSSAISRAFRQRSDTSVIFEPFTCAYYFSEDRTSHRHIDHFPIGDPEQNYTKQWDKVLAEPSGSETLVFTKDFPMCIPESLWPEAPLEELQHIFLIRHPSKCLKSMMAQVQDDSNTEWEGFDADEAGYKELSSFHTYVTEELGHDVIIFDSDEFAAQPERGLRLMTEAIGVEYDSCMMKWDPEKRLDTNWSGWNPFFERVQTEDGFKVPQKGKKLLKGATDHSTPLPLAIQTHVEDALPSYERLFEQRAVI